MLTRLLFTGGGGAGSESIYRQLSSTYDVHFADAQTDLVHPVIPRENVHKIPWACDPQFKPALAALCETYSINLLIPGVDEELVILSRDLQYSSTKILLPNTQYVSLMLDKYLMYQAFMRVGLLMPKTALLSDDFSILNPPYVVKPRNGRGSRNLKYLESCTEAEKYRDYLAHSNDLGSFVIQERIVGQEYTVQMIANTSGTLKCIVPVCVDVKKGITLDAYTHFDEQLIHQCAHIHSKLPTSGTYNIQLMQTSDGLIYPFEINPRISTTFCLVLASGVDPIHLFFDESPESSRSFEFSSGIRLTRSWTNVFTSPSQ